MRKALYDYSGQWIEDRPVVLFNSRQGTTPAVNWVRTNYYEFRKGRALRFRMMWHTRENISVLEAKQQHGSGICMFLQCSAHLT